MNKKIIPLEFPFTVDGTKYNQLELRRPKVRDMMASDEARDSAAKKECYMFSTLAEVPEAVIFELDAKDYEQLQEAYQGFLDSTGKNAAKPA